jgi:ABC-type lipoprotein export system ATPase subunit
MQLTATDLAKSYDCRPVLTGVTFTLQPGEQALLLGPSGSGKSTLLNLLCGLQRADSGRVTLGDAPIDDAVRRRYFGIVFQSLRLVSALTLRGNLALAQKLQTGGSDPALIDALLDRLGIAHRANARPHELSQGEAQRAAIARALVVRPAILVADEPTSALDAANAARVAGMLLDLARENGATLIVATHDDRLRPNFPRTLSLHEGRLAA